MKIAILGYSGAGKSTLARKLGELYRVPVLHLDQVQFIPGWVVRDQREAADLVSAFMEQPEWVIDGNYGGFHQRRRLEEADKILILNFPRLICLYRVLNRWRLSHGRTREDMAPGCPEKVDREFLWWVLHEGRNRARREHFRRILAEWPDKALALGSQRRVDEYLRGLMSKAGENTALK